MSRSFQADSVVVSLGFQFALLQSLHKLHLYLSCDSSVTTFCTYQYYPEPGFVFNHFSQAHFHSWHLAQEAQLSFYCFPNQDDKNHAFGDFMLKPVCRRLAPSCLSRVFSSLLMWDLAGALTQHSGSDSDNVPLLCSYVVATKRAQ